MHFPAKRWIRRPGPERDGASVGGASTRAGLIDRLLAVRGIDGDAARKAFLAPTLRDLQPPDGLFGAVDAAAAVCEAVRARRRIAIYGDYDVDGVMATAILWHMLRAIAPDLEVRTYVPHRIEEGYGLNCDALRALRADGIDFVVTVDCGVCAVEEARLARELGIELVITDHHELKASGGTPVARAVVHPRLGTSHRFGDLCGAGVAWKLAWRIAEEWCGSERLPQVLRERLIALLPLAAMGTVADVVPLVGENRVIVARGLLEIERTGIPGVDALLASARIEPGRCDSETVAFRLAPRINACGRMGHAELAVELLTTAGRARADRIAEETDALNRRRQAAELAIFKEASARLGAHAGGAKPRGIVLAAEDWNLGIVGIVCAKLVELHACPAILLTRNREVFKGSGRSVPGIELHRVLAECSEHLVGFGGHAMAAGLTIDGARIEAFAEAFGRACDRLLPPPDDQRVPLEIDDACRLDELDLASVGEIDRLGPFGRENRRPSLLVEDVEVRQVRPFGPTGEHLELLVRQPSGRSTSSCRLKWWRSGSHLGLLAPGSRIDVVVEPSISHFRGVAEVAARLVDLRIRIDAPVEPALAR